MEVAAITHDIACPLCRAKYGNTNSKHQETEGEQLVVQFLKDSGIDESILKRVQYLVGHHHTLTEIDGTDHQILIEADYIANASEKGYRKQSIENFMKHIFKTEVGKELLKSVFRL